MTAYGTFSLNLDLGRFTIEIQCLNRKFLEINISMPKEFLGFEIDIRKQVAEKIARGQININIFFRQSSDHAMNLVPNLALAKGLKSVWDQISSQLNLQMSSDAFLQIIAKEKDLIFTNETIDEEQYRKILYQLVESALKNVLYMKEKEGEALALGIEKRLHELKHFIDQITEKSPLAVQKYYLKLKQRLEELFVGSPENEEKIMREIAIYAEKLDISEEITRFNSHLEQFHHFLTSSIESAGKTLEFLIQELHREINTIGSKSADTTISHLVIAVKAELEKIREQIQNVE